MGMTRDESKLRDIFIIKHLQKGHSRRWIIRQVEDRYKVKFATAKNAVNRVGALYNKELSELSEDAAKFIYDTLINVIDNGIEEGDKTNIIKACDLLAKICKVTEDKPSVVVNNYGFDFGTTNEGNTGSDTEGVAK